MEENATCWEFEGDWYIQPKEGLMFCVNTKDAAEELLRRITDRSDSGGPAEEIVKGTIVQIVNEQHQWFPCLIIVDEIKSWGIQGYITLPNNNKEETNGNAFIRLKTEEFEVVGKANIVIQ